jgi:hypothetical protein
MFILLNARKSEKTLKNHATYADIYIETKLHEK